MSNGGGISDGDGPGGDGIVFGLNEGTVSEDGSIELAEKQIGVEFDSYWFNAGDINGDHIGAIWDGAEQNVQVKVPHRYTETAYGTRIFVTTDRAAWMLFCGHRSES